MKGLELDFVVKDSLVAIDLYEKIFDIKILEKTNFEKGQNEVIFTVYDTRLHMLDENKDFGLVAPGEEGVKFMWFNIMVEDIKEVHDKAIKENFIEIQEITKLEDFGVSNSVIKDPFGYMWMIHEIHKEVSFEDRMKIFEEELKGNK